MVKVRVYVLAKELGVDSKDVLAELEKAGMAAKSPSANLADEQVELVKKKLGGRPTGVKLQKPRFDYMRPPARPTVTAHDLRESPVAREEDLPSMPVAAKRAPRPAPEPEEKKRPVRPERPPVVVEPLMEEVAPAEAVAAVEEKPVEEVVHVVESPAEAPAVEVHAETPAPVAEAPAPPVEEAPAAPAVAVVEAVEPPVAPVVEAPTVPPAISAPAAQEPPQRHDRPRETDRQPSRPGQQPQPQRPGQQPQQQRPGQPQPQRPGQPPQQQRPGQPQAPEGQNKFGKKPKPVSKGPKPVRTDGLEALEGVERTQFIPAKLKDMLQPVKKGKAGPKVEPQFPKKEEDRWAGGKGGSKKRQQQSRRHRVERVDEQAATVVRKKAIKITEGISIKDFAEKIGQKSGDILKKLFEMGMMATINQAIDADAAVIIADTYGLKLEVTPITDEEAFVEEATPDTVDNLVHRAPVVTIMGHVDHGKTSLLDSIRSSNVTGGEAGGITQHIGAYKVRLNDKDIVFLDTPGHEAFTAMRARGAQVTDIVVLVVAADDGVKPQTIEAINHSKAAKVPIIVAVNKIDKPEADQDKVKRELADHGLVPEEWGGDTIFVPVSAKKRIGIESLLEMILLQADVMELKANPDKYGRGTIVEAKLDKGRGPVATVLVSTGTLRPGDAFVTGQHFGRIRILLNDKGKKVKEAGPATPVEVIGLSGVPQAGDSFVVMEDEKKARLVAQSRMQKQRETELAQRKRLTLDDLFSQIQQGEVKELNIIIKADVQGSVEALADSLIKLSTEAVKLKVIHGSVGAITESDIMLASASNAIIIGFNIRPEPKASALAEGEGVDVRLYNIIYNAMDEIRAAMEGLLEPTIKEKTLGRAEVRQIFSVPKIGVIAGTYVLDGIMSRNCAGVRVLRDNVVVYQGRLSSLKRFKEDAKEVQTGYECGIGIENFNDLKVGDIIEGYIIEKTATKL